MIAVLVQAYRDEVKELAETTPNIFGESAAMADADPTHFACHRAALYRDILASKSLAELEALYREVCADTN